MSTEMPPAGRDSDAATSLQILATEHWSLLATRSLTYTEALGRVTIFLAILSGAVIALSRWSHRPTTSARSSSRSRFPSSRSCCLPASPRSRA